MQNEVLKKEREAIVRLLSDLIAEGAPEGLDKGAWIRGVVDAIVLIKNIGN